MTVKCRISYRLAVNDQLTRWSLAELVALVPGSSRSFWRRVLPSLVSRHVLVKSGKGWLGRRGELERALLEDRSVS